MSGRHHLGFRRMLIPAKVAATVVDRLRSLEATIHYYYHEHCRQQCRAADGPTTNMANSTQQNQQMLLTDDGSRPPPFQPNPSYNSSSPAKVPTTNRYAKAKATITKRSKWRPRTPTAPTGPAVVAVARPSKSRQPFQYCWTHGTVVMVALATAADGHVATATYANMQGSTRNCHWLKCVQVGIVLKSIKLPQLDPTTLVPPPNPSS
jgi:hypothetical protein